MRVCVYAFDGIDKCARLTPTVCQIVPSSKLLLVYVSRSKPLLLSRQLLRVLRVRSFARVRACLYHIAIETLRTRAVCIAKTLVSFVCVCVCADGLLAAGLHSDPATHSAVSVVTAQTLLLMLLVANARLRCRAKKKKFATIRCKARCAHTSEKLARIRRSLSGCILA